MWMAEGAPGRHHNLFLPSGERREKQKRAALAVKFTHTYTHSEI
jgi:hypothetical protein